MKELNDSLLLAINGWAGHSSLLDGLMVFSAKYLIYIVIVAVLVCLGLYAYRKDWKTVAYFCGSLVMAFALLQLAAFLNLDHRPFMDHQLTQLISHAPGKSFPSDHTTASTALAVAVLVFTKYKKTGALLLIAAVLIGFSRIFVGVHYPLDILGGLVTGTFGVYLTLFIKVMMDGTSKNKIAFASRANK